jgi:hypothetical protein
MPLDLKVRIVGSEDSLRRALEQLSVYETGFVTGAQEALLAAANVVFNKSQEYVPVDTGDLRSSGVVTEYGQKWSAGGGWTGHMTETPGTFGVMISYGGRGVDYAVIVHEDLRARHAPPTSAKYLERAVNELAPSLGMTIAEGAERGARRAA